MNRSVAALGFVLLAACGAEDETDSPAAPTDVDMTATDFPCLTTMESTGRYRFTNLLDDLEAARAVADSPTGGVFPAGTLLQLVPTEAMVKRVAGWNAATNDWEFFALDVSSDGSVITARGGAEVINRFGGSCFDCHDAAEAQWDLVCGVDHGCAPLGLTQETIQGLQNADPRCQ